MTAPELLPPGRHLRFAVVFPLAAGTLGLVWLLVVALDALLLHGPAGWTALLAVGAGALALLGVARGLVSFGVGAVRHRRAARALRALEVAPGVVGDPVPRALCVGLLRPRVIVTTGLLSAIEVRPRAAVIAHEQAHARQRDPLRQLVARAAGDALFFWPRGRCLADRHAALAELAADAAADRSALAAAMLRLPAVAPERVDRLLGAPTSLGVGRRVMAESVGVLAAIPLVASAVALAILEHHHLPIEHLL